jgi:LmbE family N-acetylglucosaminyl deacetylase
MRRKAALLAYLLLTASLAVAQRNLAGTAELKTALDKLRVLGSVLYMGAHPDDENTALMAYFARGRLVRTAYLSLTRGEGGQNLIGPELGARLGMIRTQELLDARRIDGASQFFSRAIDFGYSKTAEETLRIWGHEAVLADTVWVIRRFQPDVIVQRFSGAGRDGHGHHQASSMLAREAMIAAADRSRFPEQLKFAPVWQVKRLLWNAFASASDPTRLTAEIGAYNPVLGFSYTEIGGMARSMHRTQGFGAPERKGAAQNYMVHVAGDPASKDLFDGIDLSWRRVQGGAAVDEILARAARALTPDAPEKIVPLLVEARRAIKKLDDAWAARKLEDLDQVIALATGLWLDATAERDTVVPGAELKLTATALNRSPTPMSLIDVSFNGAASEAARQAPSDLAFNTPVTRNAVWKVPAERPYTQPYWLAEPSRGGSYTVASQELVGRPESPAAISARFKLRVESEEIEFVRPVVYRWVDRVRGELTRPVVLAPPVAVRFGESAMLFPDAKSRKAEVRVNLLRTSGAAGEVRLNMPRGWTATPSAVKFQLTAAGEQASLIFDIQPPASASRAELRAVALVDGREVGVGHETIQYDHIPPQTLFPPAVADLVRADVRTLARNVGYVMGAGDEVPKALDQLGCRVTLLTAEDLAGGDLSDFDAIVTGIRAYNVRADLRANQRRLLEYVSGGGTLVVQYNVLEGGFLAGDPRAVDHIGPYPIRISRDRVSVEQAPVTLPTPDHPVLAAPNRVAASDFEGWVQERGLYFASEWDQRYQPLFESHDPGEPPRLGGTLFTRYGKGAYVFTGYSWFRQLPAGVPGAFRIFANLISAARSAQ